MIVNELVKTFGFTRDKLSHFNIHLYKPVTEKWVTLKHPTVDEYIYVADRQVIDWIVENGTSIVDITVYMEDEDLDIFAERFKEDW